MEKTTSFWVVLLLAGVFHLESATCDAGLGQNLLQNEIFPLLSNHKLVSCNQCHFADFSNFERRSSCQNFASMTSDGLIDLQEPDSSKILQRILKSKTRADSSRYPAIDREYAAFFNWIAWHSKCSAACPPESSVYAQRGEEYSFPLRKALFDTGGCSDSALAVGIQRKIYIYGQMCQGCHVTNSQYGGDSAAPWLSPNSVVSNNMTNALWTLSRFRAIYAPKYDKVVTLINVNAPESSWLVMKPLFTLGGGMEHGGGAKFGCYPAYGCKQAYQAGKDTQAYKDFLSWLNRYSACQKSVSVDLSTYEESEMTLKVRWEPGGVAVAEFTLPREGAAELSVFDVKGQRVKTLFRGTRSEGREALSWRPQGLAPGLYIFRLQGPEGEVKVEKALRVDR